MRPEVGALRIRDDGSILAWMQGSVSLGRTFFIKGVSMTDIWHRHETVGDEVTGMEHAHDGGGESHHHDIPAQAKYNNYAGAIDGPANEDANVAERERDDAAAEIGELADKVEADA